MTLEILIAQYKETEKDIKPMLDSIALQQGVDFEDINVIIANDGSKVILSDYFLEQYPFNIDYYLVDHLGLSGIRNFLLDRATADYIMFCDADDMFLYNHAFYLILKEIKSKQFDFLFPDFMKENRTADGEVFFVPLSRECHVHGKVLRRQYLLDNNIRWKEELVTHDSRYFFILCESCTTKDKIIYSKVPYYLWKWNEKSRTHTENWHLKTYNYFTLSIFYLVEELMRRGLTNNAQTSAISFIYLTYFLYSSAEWQNPKNKEMVDSALQGFSKFYKKYGALIDLLTPEQRATLIEATRNNVANREKGIYLEKITFSEWIKIIESI